MLLIGYSREFGLIRKTLGGLVLLRWIGAFYLFLTKSRWQDVDRSIADFGRKLFTISGPSVSGSICTLKAGLGFRA